MPIAPLTALAIPAAGMAAVKLAERLGENRPFASLLANVRGGESAAPSNDPAGKAGRDLGEFAALVQQRLAAAGVHTSIRFELTADADGRLRVAGEHPQKQRIEQALAGDDELAGAFAQLAASHHLDHVHQRRAEFAEQYVSGAISRSNTPPVITPGRFSVIINGDEVSLS